MLPKENPSSLSNLMLSALPSFFALSPCCANSTDSSQSIKNLRGAASHLKSNIFLHLYYHFASSNSQLISQSAVFQPSCNLRSRRRQASLDSVRLWKGDIRLKATEAVEWRDFRITFCYCVYRYRCNSRQRNKYLKWARLWNKVAFQNCTDRQSVATFSSLLWETAPARDWPHLHSQSSISFPYPQACFHSPK